MRKIMLVENYYNIDGVTPREGGAVFSISLSALSMRDISPEVRCVREYAACRW